MQVLKLSKLYQLSTYARTDPVRMMNDLQALLRAGLRVLDVQTGLPIVEGATLESMPPFARERTYALPGDSDSRLMILEYPGEEVSSFLLIHVLQVVDVALSQLLRSLRRRSERSAQTLASVLEGRSPDGLETLLGPSGTSLGYQLVAVALEDGNKAARAASIQSLPVLAGFGGKSFFILMPEQSRNEVRQLLQRLDVRAGASSTYLDLRDAKAAADEAEKVFSSGGTNDQWTDFIGVPVSLLTRSRKEASAIVQQVLGGLAGTDPKSTALRETLFTFLAHDRSWNETAAALGIHRQTLSYRLTRIKEVTGRDIASSADFSAFWLAFQAWPSYSARSD